MANYASAEDEGEHSLLTDIMENIIRNNGVFDPFNL